ncbi:MAG: hypothetical protein ACOX2N_09300 [Peptococcia bacterium]
MKFSMRMEINYYQQNEASLILDSDNSAQAESFGEILLFCCFTLRLLVKFGQSNAGYALAMSLFEISENLKKVNDANSFNVPKLVEYNGKAGQKWFSANLKYDSNNKFNFKMLTGGFGFLGKELDFYGINAVMLFLSYLVENRRDDQIYMMRLTEIVKKCEQVFISRQLTKKNEKKMALVIAGTTI